jgi:(E)-4-hydroxy-3-methylbut-2-enyl-diphosphate synthase
MTKRENTGVIHIGGMPMGGGNPIVIESMTTTDTRDICATAAQVDELAAAGCEIIRIAIPDEAAAHALAEIKRRVGIPIIADIHFDYKLAILSAQNGADKLRINPGNIGDADRVRAVAEAAHAAGIPIRVGVNGGSLSKEMLDTYGGVTAEAMAASAMQGVKMLEDCGFTNIAVSAKCSDAVRLIEANRMIAALPYPLHIGLTEAGTVHAGSIRSAAALGAILHMGIGDAIRVSLAGDPMEEIIAAREILSAMNLRHFGVRIIACPTCGRTTADIAGIAARVEDICRKTFAHVNSAFTVAVMGCEVNGPGEAREADIGVAVGKGTAMLFCRGEALCKIHPDEIENGLISQIREMLP